MANYWKKIGPRSSTQSFPDPCKQVQLEKRTEFNVFACDFAMLPKYQDLYHRHQSIDLQSKPTIWFLYDGIDVYNIL